MTSTPIKVSLSGTKITYLLLAIVTWALLLLALGLPLQPTGYALHNWQEKQAGGWKNITMPVIEMLTPGLTSTDLRITFPNVDADTLVIPRQSGNAIEVRLNGRVIYTLGDLSQPTANLWNYVHLVKLPEPLQEQNLLEIRLASSYFASGLSSVPYLSHYQQAASRATFLNWLYDDMLEIATGAALIIGLLLIILAFIRRTPWNVETYIGLALIFSAVYSQDFPLRLTTGSLTAFLWTKKIYMLGGYLASICFMSGLEKYFWDRLKISSWFGLLTVLASAGLLAASGSYSVTMVSGITNWIIFINLLGAVGFILFGKPTSSWLLLPASWLGLSVLQGHARYPFEIYLASRGALRDSGQQHPVWGPVDAGI